LAYIDETVGKVDRSDRDSYDNYRDTVWNSIMNFGTNVTFNQSVSANYKVPINKIPILDWVNADVRYTGSYNWQRAPFSQDSLGHTIQNARTLSLSGGLNFLTLYNNVGYFKKVNQKFQRQNRGAGRALTPSPRTPARGRTQEQEEAEKGK